MSVRVPFRLRSGSLGRRIVFISTANAVLLIGAIIVLVQVTAASHARLQQATTSYVEEQAIADRISAAVSRQLGAAAAFPRRADDERARREFIAAGDDAYESIRQYLFRDLLPAQRLQLERSREAHQRMEIAASRAVDLLARQEADDALVFLDRMIDAGLTFQTEVTAFLQMREAGLGELQRRQVTAFRYLYLGAGVFALLVTLAGLATTRLFYNRVARPLARLVDATARIRDGDMAARVETPDQDELATVADSFNRMADRLSAMRDDLERRNHQLTGTLEQLRETQAELIQTEKLSAVGRMMAGLAHELNNPLASVLGYGQLLEARLAEGNEIPARQLADDFVRPLVAEAARARELVHGLLRFSRRSTEFHSAVPVAEALRMTVRIQAFAFEQAGLELRLEAPTDADVQAEPQRLQQVFMNIIHNAYDAMRPAGSGTLTIRTDTVGGRVLVTFEDDGPGLLEPGRVFEPFYTTKPVGEGTGLGLTMVHRFIEECSGDIVAENRPEGGARFTLTLPLTAADGDTADGDAPGTTIGMGAPTAPVAPVTAAALRILVVEDEKPLRNLQRRMLGRLQADVLVAGGGQAARAILEEQEVDLVISDVKMPAGDGLELYRWIEEARPGLVDRFIFVTGDVGDPDIAALAERRPDRFIRKPFVMSEYLDRVVAVSTGR